MLDSSLKNLKRLIVEDNKPFPYAAAKAVFGFLPMIKREELIRGCKEFRKIDKIVPCPLFNFVSFGEFCLKIDNRYFRFGVVGSDGDDVLRRFRPTEAGDMIVQDDIVLENFPYHSESDEDDEFGDNADRNHHLRQEVRRLINRSRNNHSREDEEDDDRLRMKMVCPQGTFIKDFDDKNQFPSLMRKLIASHFDRPHIIWINSLYLRDSRGVYRVPAGLRMRIRSLTLTLNAESLLRAFEDKIVEESFPLESVTFPVMNFEDQILKNPIVCSATRLNIMNRCLDRHFGLAEFDSRILPEILKLTNPTVVLNQFHFSRDMLISIAMNMVTNCRELGASILYSLSPNDSLLDVQNELVASHAAARRVLPDHGDTPCVTIPVTEDTELSVFESEETVLCMAVMKTGTAVEAQDV